MNEGDKVFVVINDSVEPGTVFDEIHLDEVRTRYLVCLDNSPFVLAVEPIRAHRTYELAKLELEEGIEAVLVEKYKNRISESKVYEIVLDAMTEATTEVGNSTLRRQFEFLVDQLGADQTDCLVGSYVEKPEDKKHDKV